jgi:hypothetical protein
MARIRCKYIGCNFLDQGVCSATVIELDPDEGCLTFTQVGDPFEDDDDWDDDDLDGYEEWDDEDDYSDSLYDDDDDDY